MFCSGSHNVELTNYSVINFNKEMEKENVGALFFIT